MDQVRATIDEAESRCATVTGIMLAFAAARGCRWMRPVLQHAIDPIKDVEGVSPANIGYVVYGHTLIAPCTALAVIELIKSAGRDLRGVEAVVVGASEIAGSRSAKLLADGTDGDGDAVAILRRRIWQSCIRGGREVLVVAVGEGRG